MDKDNDMYVYYWSQNVDQNDSRNSDKVLIL